MSRKGAKTGTLIFLALAVLFSFTSCKNLKLSKLQANHHFTKANGHYTDGLFRQAIKEYEEALRLNPELVEAYHFLGEAYKQIYRPGIKTEENLERANKALEILQKAYDHFPEKKQIIYSLGDMYDKMRNFEEAEKFYIKILELEPGNMDNYYVVAEFYKRYAGGDQKTDEETGEDGEIQEGKTPFQKALEMYLRRIETDPENPQGYSYLARFYELPPLNDFDGAMEIWDKLIILNPGSADGWYNKGVNRWAKAFRVPDLPKAQRLEAGYNGIDCLNKAVELDPDYPEPHSWLSVIYQSVLAQLEPEKASRHKADGQKHGDRYQALRKRAAAKEKLAEELRK